MLTQNLKALYDLSGYVQCGDPVIRTFNGKTYSVQEYQGTHQNEYVVMELQNGNIPNGPAQLFKNGVMKMSWNMKEGEQDGVITTYKNGVADKVIAWDTLNGMGVASNDGIISEMMNDESGKRLLVRRTIRTDIIVYKGECNEHMEKDGYGVEYDEKSGREKFSGYFYRNKLVHVHQEFEEEDGSMIMTEYAGNGNRDNPSDNTSLLRRVPIYVGEYTYNSSRGRFVPHGRGNQIDQESGLCSYVGEWQNGMKVDSNGHTLQNGWYSEGESTSSIRAFALHRDARTLEIVQVNMREECVICPELSISRIRGIEECIIGEMMYNNTSSDISKMQLTFTNMPYLKRIRIGYGSLQNVRGLVVENLERLESLRVGPDCFRITSRWKFRVFDMNNARRGDGICRISKCPELKEVFLGNNSFCDFKSFDISEVRSLQSIDFGNNSFWFADLKLQSRYLYLAWHD